MTVAAPPARGRRPLWTPEEVFAAAMLSGSGALMLLAAWAGASNTGRLDHQGAWLSLAVGGLVVAGAAGAKFLLVGFRNIYTGAGDLLAAGAASTAPESTAHELAHDVHEPGALVAVAGTVRYHRPDCVLARGKNVVVATPAAHVKAGRAACPLCLP